MKEGQIPDQNVNSQVQAWKEIFSVINIPLAYLDREFNFISVNKSYGKEYEKDADFFIGKNYFDLNDKEDEDLFRKIINLGEGYSIFSKPFKFDKGTKYLDLSIQPIRENDKVVGLIISLTDVSEKIKYKETLQKEENELNNIKQNLSEVEKVGHIGNWEWDAKNKKLWWSDELFRIFGFKPQEFTPTYEMLANLIHPGDRAFVMGNVNNARYQNKPYRIEYRIMSGNTIHFIHEEVEIITSETGEILKVIGAAQDITRQKSNELSLREHEMQLNKAQKIAHIGNWEIDILNNTLQWSNEIYHIFGIEKEKIKITYEKFLDLIHPADKESVSAQLKRAMYEGEYYNTDYRIICARGDIRFIHSEAEVTFDENAKPIKIFGTMQDISEHKYAEESLKKLNRSLRTLSLCNQILVHATSEQELLDTMCQIIVEQGGYRMAWVGIVEHDEAKSIRAVAQKGFEEGYLDTLKLTWADTERGRGPTGRAVRNKTTQVTQNIQNDPNFTPWKGEAEKRGYNSTICLPLISNEEVFATLNIYAAEADGFPKSEVDLLQELSEDLSFGIISLRTETERNTAVKERNEYLEKLREGLENTIRVIATTIEIRDPYTAGHQKRVADIAAAIGKELHLSEEDIHAIHLAGTVHDFGKIRVPSEILTNPGHLDEVEFNFIKKHPQVGYDILKDIEFPWPIADMVLQHHERLNGTGYPQGLKNGNIIMGARIIAVADVVESMASRRPYRSELGVKAAMDEIIQGKSTLYDPDVVDACIKIIKENKITFTFH